MGVVQFASPDEVTASIEQERQQRGEQQAAFEAAVEQAKSPANDLHSNMAAYVRACWSIAKTNRHLINDRLLDCLRRRKGEYTADKLQELKLAKSSAVFMQVTGAKCRSAKAWLSDLFSPAGDRPFTLEPSAKPDLPENIKSHLISIALDTANEAGLSIEQIQAVVMEHYDRIQDELVKEGETRAERMATVIEDRMMDAGWRVEFDDFLDDLVTYPSAIMKGLEFRRAKTLNWVDSGGQWKPVPGFKIQPTVRRVSPFRVYPSPSSGSKIENHWMIEHHSFTRADLVSMRNAPGYIAQNIAKALLHYGQSGLREWMFNESERARLEDRSAVFNEKDEIDALELCGSISGQMLSDWGMQDESIDVLDEYSVSIMVIGNYVIRAVVNPDPAGKPDYMAACWQPLPGSFWGTALPEQLADCQDVCNGSARSLVNNMAFASGPQVGVDVSKLRNGENATEMYPWKTWLLEDTEDTGSQLPIHFYQPSSNANELMGVYERFSNYADDICGLPKYASGSDTGAGAAQTMGGLGMLLNAAGKNIKAVVREVDIHVIEPMVLKFFNHEMLTNEDEMIKGDLRPKARGSESLVHREQALLRSQELLGITNNPIDSQIMGIEGRRELLAETLKTGDIPVDRILPTAEELREKMAQQAQQQVAQERDQLAAAA